MVVELYDQSLFFENHMREVHPRGRRLPDPHDLPPVEVIQIELVQNARVLETVVRFSSKQDHRVFVNRGAVPLSW